MHYKLPKGWALAPISDLIGIDGLFVDGDWIETKDQDPNGNIRLIQLADIGDGDFKDKSNRFMTYDRALNLNCTFLKQGDILMARMPDPLGRAITFPFIENERYVTIVDIAIIRPGSGIYNKWLMYFINSPQIRKNINALQTGTTRKRISRTNIAKIKIPVPPLNEQYKIVEKIEEHLSELDKCKELLEIAIKKVKLYRKTMLNWAFEGKLSNDVVEEGKLPKGWELHKLIEICEIIGGVTKGRNLEGRETMNLPYLRVANVQDGYLDLKEIKTIQVLKTDKEKYKLNYGDILYTEGGDRDKLGRGTIWREEIKDCIHQNHIFRARVHSRNIDSRYVAYYSQTKEAKDYFIKNGKQTTNLASINISILSNLPVPVCSLDEQILIIQELERRLSVCKKVEDTIAYAIRKISYLKESILKKAVSGELINQDLTDEGADILLKRIDKVRSGNLKGNSISNNVAAKKVKMKQNELGILEILEKSSKPMLARTVWEQSKHKNDIESFYAELKNIQNKIKEVEKGVLTFAK